MDDSVTLILAVCGVVGVGMLLVVVLFLGSGEEPKKTASKKKDGERKHKAQSQKVAAVAPKQTSKKKKKNNKNQQKKQQEQERKEQERKEQERKEQEREEQEREEQEREEQERKEQEEQARKEQEEKARKEQEEKERKEQEEKERKEQEEKERKEQEEKARKEQEEKERKEQELKKQEQEVASYQYQEQHKGKRHRNRHKHKNQNHGQQKQEEKQPEKKEEKQPEKKEEKQPEKKEEPEQPHKKRKNLSKAQRQRLKREREAAEKKAHEQEHPQQHQQQQHQHQKPPQNNKGKQQEPEKKKLRVAPTKNELEDVAHAAEHLWTLDVNRLTPNKDYAINLQSGKKVYQSHDAAAEPLFKYLNKDLFFQMPTYKAFYYLLDNYERSTGEKEIVTDQEHKENWDFLDCICSTPCMQYVHNYLVSKRLSDRNMNQFKKQLYSLWFELYRREGYDDSSGFEHVFVGEEKDGKVIGFHNWVQFFIEEVKGNVDYKGYILPRRIHRHTELPDGDEHILSLQFSWGDELKNVSTSFIGVSPEFEVALYTLMFLASGERTEVVMDDFKVAVRCYHIKTRKGIRIGTSFPELLDQ